LGYYASSYAYLFNYAAQFSADKHRDVEQEQEHVSMDGQGAFFIFLVALAATPRMMSTTLKFACGQFSG